MTLEVRIMSARGLEIVQPVPLPDGRIEFRLAGGSALILDRAFIRLAKASLDHAEANGCFSAPRPERYGRGIAALLPDPPKGGGQ